MSFAAVRAADDLKQSTPTYVYVTPKLWKVLIKFLSCAVSSNAICKDVDLPVTEAVTMLLPLLKLVYGHVLM